MPKRDWMHISLIAAVITFVLLLVVFYLELPFFFYNAGKAPIYSRAANLAANAQGDFVNNDPSSSDLKLLLQPLRLTPRTDYTVSFTIKKLHAEKPVVFSEDFVGTGFHRQFDVKIEPGTQNRTITHVFNSGEAVPDDAYLRLYFASPASISIANISVVGKKAKLRRAFEWTIAACLLLILILGKVNLAGSGPLALTWRGVSQEQKIQAVFILAFLTLISAPTIQKKFKLIPYKSLNENRNKLEPPAGNMLTALYSQGIEYSKAYEKYFNDHYGLRDLFIQMKNQMDFTLFRRSDEVIIGKTGQMEYKNVLANEEISAERLNSQDWEKIYANLNQFRAYLEQRGITLILLPIPMKFTVYPEFYPQGLIVRPEKTAFDRLLEYLSQHQEFHVVNAREILQTAKQKYPVFYKTDFHWNEVASFLTAKATVDQIGELSGQSVRWSHPLEFTYKPGFTGGLDLSLAVLFPPVEDHFEIKPTWSPNGKFTWPAEPPFGVHFKAHSRTVAKLLPKTMIIGDSFTNYHFENAGFYQYFYESYFLHSANLHDVPKYLPADVKFLIYEFLEAHLAGLANVEAWSTYKVQDKNVAPSSHETKKKPGDKNH